MYLSLLILEPGRDTYRTLGDVHALHRLIMSGFPPATSSTPRAEFGVLFRVEPAPPGEPVSILVQSEVEPRWPPTAGQEVRGPKSLAALLAGVSAGRRYRFRLRANPTRRVHVRAADGADPQRGRARPEHANAIGKRVAIHGDELRLQWLARQGEQHGFRLVRAALASADLPAAAILGKEHAEYWLGNRRAGQEVHRITVDTALFEGVLEVADPDRFREALRAGIGPAKAFGSGLLSVAPVA
jgi:CRISPR system Cascade subunit CasE